MDLRLTTLVSGHLRYLGLGSPLIGESNSIELQAPVWRLGKERQLAQQSRLGGKPRIAMGIFQGQPAQLPELGSHVAPSKVVNWAKATLGKIRALPALGQDV